MDQAGLVNPVKPPTAQAFLIDAQGGIVAVLIARKGVNDAPLPGAVGLDIGDLVQIQQERMPLVAADSDAKLLLQFRKTGADLAENLPDAGRIVRLEDIVIGLKLKRGDGILRISGRKDDLCVWHQPPGQRGHCSPLHIAQTDVNEQKIEGLFLQQLHRLHPVSGLIHL